MIDAIPTAWLVEQRVPLAAFLVALLTQPSRWSTWVSERLPGGDEGDS